MEKILKELIDKQPHKLTGEPKKLFEAIMKIADERDELKKDFEIIQHEHDRLDKRNNELLKENQHYEDLMYALETYYDITEEDLEKSVKEDC